MINKDFIAKIRENNISHTDTDRAFVKIRFFLDFASEVWYNKCVLNNCLMAVVVPKSAMRTSESLKNTLSAYFQGGHIS